MAVSKTKRRHAGTLPQNMSLDSGQQKQFQTKVKHITQKGPEEHGVLYVGHIPHGFNEPQMKKYFAQFGRVRKLRMSRSKRTGGSKGYAFVQFASEGVAKIVADTMNNYLMFHRLLKCQLIPKAKVHPSTFKGASRRFKTPRAHMVIKQRHNHENTPQTEAQIARNLRRTRSKKSKLVSKLAEMDIELELPEELLKPVNIQSADSKKRKNMDDDAQKEEPASKQARIANTEENLTEKTKHVENTKRAPDVINTPNKRQKSGPSQEVPRIPKPEVTKTPKPEVPRTPKTPVPKTPKAEVPKTPVPKTPKAPVPKTPVPKTPKAEVPRTPKTPVPKTPKSLVLRTPKTPVPKTPKTPVPKTPKAEVPKTPKSLVLRTPKTPVPKTPKTPVPKAEVPKTPKTPVPKTPVPKTPKPATTDKPQTPKASPNRITPIKGTSSSVKKKQSKK